MLHTTPVGYMRLSTRIISNERMQSKPLIQNNVGREKEAKEKAAADEAAAREDLALEARRKFLEEKREEIPRYQQGQRGN